MPRAICLVAGSVARAAELRSRGWTVHAPDEGGFDLPADFRVGSLHGNSPADDADRIHLAVAALHRRQPLDAIEIPVSGGLGFRLVQAKAAGLGFDGVALVARLDGCGSFDRERAHRWPGGFAEVERDFAERTSFELADQRLAPNADVLSHVRRLVWAGDTVADAEPRPATPRSCAPEPTPLVTVGIAHFNLGAHLPETLASLAAQTYRNLEVIVIDDGSTDPKSVAVVAAMEAKYPAWRFLRQPNAGIGATRNRCLAEARGEFFVPVDADNIARPNMIEAFVRGLGRNPHLAAMSCYFLGFEDGRAAPDDFLYACRPTGGPHVLSAIRNVYGDANAVFRTEAFRSAGGYETDRGTSCEDWEAFVKLVHAGHRIGVIPDHLFEYRHRPGGFSRVTNWYANHNRVLRQFTRTENLPPGVAAELWTALLGFYQELERLKAERPTLPQRVRRRVRSMLGRVPLVGRLVKRCGK